MNQLKRMDRRQAIKWMLAAAATAPLLRLPASAPAAPSLTGYGQDPKVMEVYKPGDLWPLTLTKDQHRLVAALCDMIIPVDDKSPSASQVLVPDFIDEWVSAPYPLQRADRKTILDGLVWLDSESNKRFQRKFIELAEGQRARICDDICSVSKARRTFKKPAEFFAKFRDLTITAFYSTPEGMKDIQYVGNVPLTKFDGPPPEVLSFLKLG